MCFDLFDIKKQEFLSGDDLGDIMRAMGFRPSEEELKDLLDEVNTIVIIILATIIIMMTMTRWTRTDPVRSSSVSSASCVRPSWWRTLTWRPCRRSSRMPSGHHSPHHHGLQV